MKLQNWKATALVAGMIAGFGAIDSLAQSTMSTAPTTTNQAPQMNAADQKTAADVTSALQAEPKLKGLQITVVSNEGKVGLTGAVKDQSQIATAVKVAKGVTGVKQVSSTLDVQAGG